MRRPYPRGVRPGNSGPILAATRNCSRNPPVGGVSGETTTTPKPKTGADMFAGTDRTNYLEAKGICGAQPRRKIAADFDLPPGAHPFTVAERYARG